MDGRHRLVRGHHAGGEARVPVRRDRVGGEDGSGSPPELHPVDGEAVRLAAVTTMGGLRVQPDMTLDQLTPGDSAMLIMPGATTWDEGGNGEAVEAARAFLASGVPVAAICGATAGLARGGLLDARRHTSNAREYLAMTEYRGAGQYNDSPAVTAGDLITASGTAPLDFAREIFRRLDVYTPAVLEAWYGLYKTGQPAYFYALMQASAPSAEPGAAADGGGTTAFPDS